jgi:hypothetical protein
VSELVGEHFQEKLIEAKVAGEVVLFEKEMQKSKIGVPLMKALVEAWQWIGASLPDVAKVVLVFHLCVCVHITNICTASSEHIFKV